MNSLKMKNNFFYLLIFAFILLSENLFAQEYQVEVYISNQPDNFIVFGSVRGDNFTPIDSSFLYPEGKNVIFRLTDENPPGVYRLVLGKTPYARVMNEAPQQFDFIFNYENMVFKTDFKEPVKNLEVIKSTENEVWFEFLAKDQILQDEINSLKKEIDYYLSANDSENSNKKSTDYNTLPLARDLYIKELAKMNSELLASNMILNQRLPILDGYLSDSERIEVYRKDYFKLLDFSDERLIRSSVYTDKVFEYLVSYNDPGYTKQQREKEYIKAVDVVLPGVNKNKNVYRFIRDYLLHGFKVLQLQNVIDYINKNYPV